MMTEDLSNRIASLSPEKRAFLEKCLSRQGSAFNTFPPSFAQQRLWFIDQLEPGNKSYIMPTALRHVGSLDVPTLEKALTEIVRRHEAVRTTFAAVDGQPVQVINPAKPIKLPILDLSHLDASERTAEASRLANEEAQRPFELSKGPLFRVTLIRLAERDHILLMTLHHIISDGWSMRVLFKELSALYEAFANGRSSPLQELKIQYADYAQWQRRWLQGDVLTKQLAYWEKKLAGATPCIELPTDRSRPAVQSYCGASEAFALTAELSTALRLLGQRADATLFMTMLAAFKALLYRYTAQADIVVGSPIAGRHHLETEGLIGFFVNMLALRTDIGDNPTFRELLRRVRQTTLEAYSHQDVPLERLIDSLQIERNPSYQSLFQVVFTLDSNPNGDVQEPSSDESLRPVDSGFVSTPFDLILDILDTGRALCGRVIYNPDLFNQSTIVRLVSHYQRVLAEAASNTDKRLTEFPLSDDASGANVASVPLHTQLAEEFDF
jgi:hypothetical protein